jgi:hypothetical protein
MIHLTNKLINTITPTSLLESLWHCPPLEGAGDYPVGSIGSTDNIARIQVIPSGAALQADI